jgi:hypothetical protein
LLRNRPIQIALIILVAFLGIGSRRNAQSLPAFIAAYAGDKLWALGAFLVIGLLMPRVSTLRVAVLALALSLAVELSQLYQAPWIDGIRHTALGGLILGLGFVWSDLACYGVGVGLGICVETFRYREPKERRPIS